MRPGASMEAMTDLGGKTPGTAAQIACLLHGIEHAHSNPWEHQISAQTMERALEIMAVAVKHSQAAISLMGADEELA